MATPTTDPVSVAPPSDFHSTSHQRKQISSSNPTSDTGLPQYGFGTDLDFSTLVHSNHFLFRVYTPHLRSTDPYGQSPVEPSDAAFFIAPKFISADNSPFEASLYQKSFFIGGPPNPIGTYADAATHLDWTTRASSPFVSASFSFMWAIWDALRRYHSGVKKDVEIAVIEASVVRDRAVTALQLLRDSDPAERGHDHKKWSHFCEQSQSVFVYGYIPARAVLSSVPLLVLLSKLPSYLLRSSSSPSSSPFNFSFNNRHDTLSTIGWDYTDAARTNTFRTFCAEMSTRFQNLSPAAQLQDSTTGSVRFAAAFLRPWFRSFILMSPDLASSDLSPTTSAKEEAVEKLCLLATAIAQWPHSQWWGTQEHVDEALSLIGSIARALVDEVVEERIGRLAPVEVVLKRASSNRECNKRVSAMGLVLETVPVPALQVSEPEYESKKTSTITPGPEAVNVKIDLDAAQIRLPPSPLDLVPPSESDAEHVPTPITPPATPVRDRFIRPALGYPTTSRPRSLSVDSCDSILDLASSSSRIPSGIPLPFPIPVPELGSVAARLEFGGAKIKDVSVSIPMLPPSPTSPPARPLMPRSGNTDGYPLIVISDSDTQPDSDADSDWQLVSREPEIPLLPSVEIDDRMEGDMDEEGTDAETVIEALSSSHLENSFDDIKRKRRLFASNDLDSPRKMETAEGHEHEKSGGTRLSEPNSTPAVVEAKDEWEKEEGEEEEETFFSLNQLKSSIPQFLSPYLPSFHIPGPRARSRRSGVGMSDTASCLATGFLVGAFVTLCVLAPQRRPPALLHFS